LVHGIIEAESGHGKHMVTVEPDGDISRGPMMVKWATAKTLGVTDPGSLLRPDVGIFYGVKYLAQLLRRFKGDSQRAAAAYNGSGPHARAYAVKVLAYAKRYAAVAVPVAALVALLALVFLMPRRRAAASRGA